MHLTTNVVPTDQTNRLYQPGEAFTPQQQGFESIYEILKRLPLLRKGGEWK